MDEDDEEDLEDELAQDVLPQVQGPVNDDQDKLGHQHDQKRNGNLGENKKKNLLINIASVEKSNLIRE